MIAAEEYPAEELFEHGAAAEEYPAAALMHTVLVLRAGRGGNFHGFTGGGCGCDRQWLWRL